MNKKLDLIGEKFGQLTVINKHPEKKTGKIQWVCRCSCGNIAIVIGGNLQSGNTQSCGCKKRNMYKVK